MRQTNLSVDDLLKQLDNPMDYPRCLIINELGIICLFDNDASNRKKKAEQALRRLLRDKEEKSRDIVFAWLSTICNLDPETAIALEEFKVDPANKQIIQEMQPQIARFKMMCK